MLKCPLLQRRCPTLISLASPVSTTAETFLLCKPIDAADADVGADTVKAIAAKEKAPTRKRLTFVRSVLITLILKFTAIMKVSASVLYG